MSESTRRAHKEFSLRCCKSVIASVVLTATLIGSVVGNKLINLSTFSRLPLSSSRSRSVSCSPSASPFNPSHSQLPRFIPPSPTLSSPSVSPLCYFCLRDKSIKNEGQQGYYSRGPETRNTTRRFTSSHFFFFAFFTVGRTIQLLPPGHFTMTGGFFFFYAAYLQTRCAFNLARPREMRERDTELPLSSQIHAANESYRAKKLWQPQVTST